jgi:hypothetical protein
MDGTSLQDIKRFQTIQNIHPPSPQQLPQRPPVPPQSSDKESKELADILESDINISPDDIEPVKKEDSQSFIKKYFSNYVREPLIFIVLFFILSLEPVKNILSNWIPYLSFDDECYVSKIGAIVYGLLLFVLYKLTVKLLPY